jgi:polysaccharide export outer membrane protein
LVTTLNVGKVIDGTDMSQDIFLMPLDIVYVPKSPIANINQWVDQYIRKNIPVPFSFGYTIY